MNVNAALFREQGVNVAVISVKDHVLNSKSECDDLVSSGMMWFPGYVVALMGASGRRLYGRPDVTRFLQNISPARLPWKQYRLS